MNSHSIYSMNFDIVVTVPTFEKKNKQTNPKQNKKTIFYRINQKSFTLTLNSFVKSEINYNKYIERVPDEQTIF